jgi:hypothetical protein
VREKILEDSYVSCLIFEVGMAGPRLTRDGMESRRIGEFVIQRLLGEGNRSYETPRKEKISGVETWSVEWVVEVRLCTPKSFI